MPCADGSGLGGQICFHALSPGSWLPFLATRAYLWDGKGMASGFPQERVESEAKQEASVPFITLSLGHSSLLYPDH